MDAVIAGLFFALGAVVASFVGVLAGRLYTGQGIAAGRSRCDACGGVLEPRDLVPILSWLLARGRARCCGARISCTAPLSELALGACFALAYLSFGLSPLLPLFLLALTLLAALVLYDLAHQILPPFLLALFLLASGAFGYLSAPDAEALRVSLIVAGAFALFFFALFALSAGRAMGLADAPLVAGLAFLAGPAAPAGFLLSFWIGAAVGIALLAGRSPGARMGIEVPFAPFLAVGFLLATFTQWDPFVISELVRAALR